MKEREYYEPRLRYIDFCRAILFSLGVILHSAWLLKAQSTFLTHVHDFIHSFRMESFFLIAGFFSAMTLTRNTPQYFLRNRLVRLLLPLVVWGSLINIFLNCALRGSWHDVSFVESATYWLHEEWLGHLWFLGTLILYVLLIYGLHEVFPRAIDFFRKPFWNLSLILMSVLGLHQGLRFIYHLTLHDRYITLVVTDLEEVLNYLPVYLAGYVFFHHRAMLQQLVDKIVVNSAGVALFWAASPFLHSYWGGQLRQAWAVIYSIQVCAVLFWIARTFFNRAIPALDALSDASYTVYLVHWPLMAVLYRLMLPSHLPTLLLFLVLAIVTGILSYALHHFVISRSETLLLLLNGRLEQGPQKRGLTAWAPSTIVSDTSLLS